MMPRLRCAVLLLALLAPGASAVIETYEFSEPALEARYHALAEELRCPKCQNQNIADSDAPISRDLRRLLHRKLEEGASDQEILDFMTARYGEFVRYRPRFAGPAMFLWLAPLLLLAAGVLLLWLTLRGRGAGRGDAPLNAQERARVQALLRDREAGD